VGGQWTCPTGSVDVTRCQCGEPGLACPGSHEVCTADGWVCPDAGVDADAGDDAPPNGSDADAGDAPTDGATCGDAPNPYCGQVVGMSGDLIICGDSFYAATCVDGRWKCGPGQSSSCTCAEFHPPGCGICTAQGWACPDGGTDGDAASFGD
jgi:hypothetical protein